MKSFKATVYRFPPRLVAMTLASLLLGLTTFVVACTDFVGPDPEAETTAAKLENSEVFVVVEEMPELIGGLEAIQQDLQYPKIAKMAGIEGRVLIEFTVDAQGKVVNPKVVRGIGAGCDEEALRALQAATFKPGIQDGKAVPVKMSIPVTFRLDDKAASAQRSLTQAEQVIVEKRRIEASLQGQALAEDAEKPLSKVEEQVLTDVLKQVEKMRAQGNLVGHTEELTENQIKTLKAAMQELEAQIQNAPPSPVPSASETLQNQGGTILRQNAVNLQSMKADPHHFRKIRVYANGQLLKEGIDYSLDLQNAEVKILNRDFLNPNDKIHIEFDK